MKNAPDELRIDADSPPRLPAIDALFLQYDRPWTPGAMVSVFTSTEVFHKAAYGRSNAEHDVAWRTDAPTRIASLSKQLVAAACLQAQEDQILSLDDRIDRFFPEFGPWTQTVTLRTLLNNTSGLAVDEGLAWLSGRTTATPADLEYLRRIVNRHGRTLFEPGAAYLYNDTGFRLAAEILDRTAPGGLQAYSQRRVFSPAGMNDTLYVPVGETILPGIAATYQVVGDGLRRYLGCTESTGDGGIVSTFDDMLRWGQWLLLNSAPASPFLEALITPPVLANGRPSPYALGIDIDQHRGKRWLIHTGTSHAYCVLAICPEDDFGVLVIGNRDDLGAAVLPYRIFDILRPVADQPCQALRAFKSAAGQANNDLADLEGIYVDPDGRAITLDAGADILRLTWSDAAVVMSADEGGVFRTAFGSFSADLRRGPVRGKVDVWLAGHRSIFVRVDSKSAGKTDAARLSGRFVLTDVGCDLAFEVLDGVLFAIVGGGPTAEFRLAVQSLGQDAFLAGPISFKIVDADASGLALSLRLHESRAFDLLYRREEARA